MTDTKTLIRDTPPPDPADKPTEPKRLIDLSATQLAGGALAAMTSAIIGAQLGVAGTIAGAALGSLVAGVAGSVYTASLKHTKAKITSVIVGRVGDTQVEVSEQTTPDQTAVLGDRQLVDTQPLAAIAPPSADPVAEDAVVDERGKPTRRLSWKAILVSTAAVFLLAIAGLTVVELVSGQAVSGGQGTTITQVREGRSDTPKQAPSQSPSAEQPSTGPSAGSEPSGAASTEPSAEPTGATEPSEEPTQSTDPSASSEPTDNRSPSTGGEQSTTGSGGGAVAGG